MLSNLHQNLFRSFLYALLSACLSFSALAAPDNFAQAKHELRNHVYQDQNDQGDFYCGCNWKWIGDTEGRVDLKSCNYKGRSQQTRANRIEWEHILPASSFGQARQCWQNGGRENCARTDPVFKAMEADMHNLVPSIGEVNADRSNYRFGEIPGEPSQYGACQIEVDSRRRVVEPRTEVKGQVARAYFYMHDRYDLPMSDSQQQLYIAWNRLYPVTAWEMERDRRIAARMGHSNPFVTGTRIWEFGHRNVSDGILNQFPGTTEEQGDQREVPVTGNQSVRGNRNSRIYHLSEGCPSYGQIDERNIIVFNTEREAEAQGYRKARNCR